MEAIALAALPKGSDSDSELNAEAESNENSDRSFESDLEIDADEPTYCYCNGVSYGEMIACDADGCAKEWFHLTCSGLKEAPKGNGKVFKNRWLKSLLTIL
jgi:hypothetical protein